MVRHFSIWAVLIAAVVHAMYIPCGAQDEESELSLDEVKFREVRIIPTSESMHSLMLDVDIAELGEMVISSDERRIAYRSLNSMDSLDEGKTVHQEFFSIGSLYADLLTKLSGEYSKEVIIERIKVLQERLDDLDASDGIYIYLFNLENMVIADEYPGEVIKRFLAMLYPFMEESAVSSDALLSLQAGHWLVDLGIAAAGQNETLSRQSEVAMFLADVYVERDASEEVVNTLREIATLTSKPELSDEDFETLMALSGNLRRLLK